MLTTEIQIIIFSVIAITAIILSIRFKQPLYFWLLILGMFLGPSGIGLLSNNATLKAISDFGAILLLFIIGVKFSISKLLNQGFKILIVTSLKIIFITLPLFLIISLFGFKPLTALILSISGAITSTTIVIKTIENMGWMESENVSYLINILIVEDILAVFLLTFISGFKSITISSVIYQLLLTTSILIMVYIAAIYIIVPFTKWILKNSNDDVTPFLAISLAIGLSYFANKMGISTSAGAFLAGSIVNFLPNSSDFEFSISSFTLIFSSAFFLSIGMIISFENILSIGWVIKIIGITFFGILLKFIVVFAISFFYGWNAKNSVFSGILLIPIGEFSLLIAQESLKIGVDVVPIISTMVLLTALITPLSLRYEEKITNAIIKITPYRLKERLVNLQKVIAN